MEKEVTIRIEIIESGNEMLKSKDSTNVSMYARFFNESCPGWSKNSEYNMVFLREQQNYANNLLKSRGHLFLNDVYDMLGIARSKAGQCVGWIYNTENPQGDNYVDFGLYDSQNIDFINGHSTIALLDFNVDGMILDALN